MNKKIAVEIAERFTSLGLPPPEASDISSTGKLGIALREFMDGETLLLVMDGVSCFLSRNTITDGVFRRAGFVPGEKPP
jgi:hypothetical protein